MDCSPPGSSLHGILQARVLEWVALSFSRGSSWCRDRTQVSCIPGRHFNLWATREAQSNSQSSRIKPRWAIFTLMVRPRPVFKEHTITWEEFMNGVRQCRNISVLKWFGDIPLGQEVSTCCRVTKPVRHNYWSPVLQLLKPVPLEPLLCNKRSRHNQKPPRKSSSHLPQLEKACTQQRRPSTTKMLKKKGKFKNK